MAIQTVGVVGCGLMGSGIAQIAAQAGLKVVVREVDDKALESGRRKIDGFLAKAVEKQKITADDKAKVLGQITFSTSLDALKPCDLVVEAIVENLQAKRDLFKALDGICGPQAIFATNTSSLAVGDMAVATKRPQSFVGLHFFNPVP